MNRNTQNIIYIIILFLLLLLHTFYTMATAIDLEYSWIKKLAFLIVVIILLLVPALFLKTKIYFFLEGILNFLFFPIEIASLYLNRQPTSIAFLGNILNTDIHEAIELLSSIWPSCIVVVSLWILYFVLALQVQNTFLIHRHARRLILSCLGIVIICGSLHLWNLERRIHSTRPIRTSLKDVRDDILIKFYKIYPYNLYVEFVDIIRSRANQERWQQQLSSYHFGIRSLEQRQPVMYVLVIGETSRYDHWGINNYTRDTSPRLMQCNNLINYDSVFSLANLTSTSVPLILTRATAHNPELAYKEKSLSEAFQEAHFQTGWITKQTPIPLAIRIMETCDFTYSYAKEIDVDGNYDIDIVDNVRDFASDTMQFFVLHSLGCHFRYEQRYPQEFANFQPTFGKTFSYTMISEENKDKLINAYDNAILYTDYFLSELIHYMDSLDRPAVMLYISDHGESFWDDERKLSLHGSYQISEYEYHVPMFVWYSDEYKALYPDKVQAMHQNKTTPISSDVVFYSMLDIAGIEDIVDSTRSICSPSLVPMDTIWVFTGSGSVEAMPIR